MRYRLTACLLAAAALALGASLGFGDEGDGKEERKAPMSEQEMWMKMMEWARPGPMHEHLDCFVGRWSVKGTMYSGMGAMEFKGEAENEWVLGGRFLKNTYASSFMGMPFEGIGFLGYDNGLKQYQNVWLMTMGTGIDWSTGTYDAATKTFTWTGKTHMPDGNTYAKRNVHVVENDTQIRSTGYSTGPDGKEVKEMEMVYTRVVEDADDDEEEDGE